MVREKIDYFDIAQICESGQCFRMIQKDENTYGVTAADKYVEISQSEKWITFDCSKEEYEDFWKAYFDLDTDYGAYLQSVDVKDEYLSRASKFGSGIRILRQDLWEMIVSFLISQQNNITRIRRCIHNICTQYGEEKRSADGQIYYTFPKAEALACLDEDALKECNLGYRSKYVVRTAKSIVSEEISLEDIRQMPYGEAKQELLKLYGIGDKVADCICLFALHHLESFPVDTHIRQAIEQNYTGGFDKNRYRGFEGVMQQYIFYYELFGKKYNF